MIRNYGSTSEIEEAMAALLSPGFIEKQASANGLTVALDNLQKAADIFDNLDLVVASAAVTDVLESIAGFTVVGPCSCTCNSCKDYKKHEHRAPKMGDTYTCENPNCEGDKTHKKGS